MNWTEPTRPTEGTSHYDHVICETPFGRCLIEWKSWRQNDAYSVIIGNYYVGQGFDLDHAKQLAKDYLIKRHEELTNFIK